MHQEAFTRKDVDRVLASLPLDVNSDAASTVTIKDGHSNYLAEVTFRDGRTLMIKRVRYAEMASRFQASRIAARLLRKQAGLIVPDYMDLTNPPDGVPTLVYWHIPLPTLETLWPDLDEPARKRVLRNWGRLIRRIQHVRLPGHGPLPEAVETMSSLESFLSNDLEYRLRPASLGEWNQGVSVIEALITLVDDVGQRAGSGGGVLIHNDLFTANVLCDPVEDGRPECVGVLDLEDAFAGPPEAELAKTEVLHGPLFGRAWSGPYFEYLLEGYGTPGDPIVSTFFRVYHMVNMGFHAAVTGFRDHAAEVARVAHHELDAMGSGRRHRDVVASVRARDS